MNSQITLVNPQFIDANEPAEVLIVYPDNLKNTNIFRAGNEGQPLYTVKSNLAITETTITTPLDDPGVPLAKIERREIVSDKITIRGRETMKTKSWLKYGGIFTIKFPATFEENGRKYMWKSSIVNQISLYLASDPDRPIAWFEKSRKRVVDGEVVLHKAFLALQPEAMEIRDIVVLSFLILELKNRMGQKAEELNVGRAVAMDVGDWGV
ncbi:hypothetical protein JR316_0002900 [Psilocybe cubensis]|uniref:DUF6593 domain-containing protein n=2 Tax=Psilocybe cubensis TaxID=181762 RepID=A0A8H8CMM9_PSICU|nr:hypothetical protein JR316_0002900 [Psilocybe cubensis]KAH9483432.1 hypothetical protein JR316_0002900 [Psilocybe cubensis]